MNVYKITDEMKRAKEERIEKMCEKINRDIEYAVKHNRNECNFPYNDAPYFNELYALYTKEGYTIQPTGVIGGVYQLTNTIRW